MSAPTTPPAAPESRWRRGVRRKANACGAIVARGEPLVWLSGSALVITLCMICGLLLLIVGEGAATFWPKPVIQLSLLDGSAVMGEVAGESVYRVDSAELSRFGEKEAEAIRKLMGDRKEFDLSRRQVRIGNYELTGAHYQWIGDYEVKPDGETRPKWALVVERMERGIFYGEPAEFIVRHPRSVSGDEEQLARLLAFFDSNLVRLDDAGRKEAEPELESLRKELRGLQTQSAKSLLEETRTEAGERAVDVVLEDGSTVELDAVPPEAIVVAAREHWTAPGEIWAQFEKRHESLRGRREAINAIKNDDIGAAGRREEDARLELKSVGMRTQVELLPLAEELRQLEEQIDAIEADWDAKQQVVRQVERRLGSDSPLGKISQKFLAELKTEHEAALEEPRASLKAWKDKQAALPESTLAALSEFREKQQAGVQETAKFQREIDQIEQEIRREEIRLRTAGGQEAELLPAEIVRAYPANRLTLTEKLGVYFSRWKEFLIEDPREANTEGGVFPAIWGTITMTLIMSLAVAPFGVLAALYLKEYARAGFLVSAVRIAVNNLAGVPSIVFGVFGLGFFCYIFGAYIDGGPKNAGFTPWPSAPWFYALGGLAALSVSAFALGLLSTTSRKAEANRRKRWMGRTAMVFWLGSALLFVVVLAKSPFFGGFYATSLPNPTFGKGGLMWAALTLSLMTLPVVIVATEEALAAVPNSMREGSYACGASKWQTIQRIVLPRALPGIMTGMILAMARGAGEVAPLMLVGAVKFVPELPLDTEAPFLHPDRSFMHLGFHIFDLAFQSPNSEAAKPMVFTTTLLLITIIAALNLTAIWLRSRLRRRFKTAQF